MKSMWWRFAFVAGLALLAAYSVVPTGVYFSMPKDVRNDAEKFANAVPNGFPKEHVKLGLDLQGGVQLVLGVDTSTAVLNKLGRIGVEAKRWGDSTDGVAVEKAYVAKENGTLAIVLPEGQDTGDFKEKFKEEFFGLVQIARDGQKIEFGYEEDQIKKIRSSALDQAERVVRARVDKWGVAEPVINKRADGSIIVQLPGFKDPGKAKDLLGRTAQLSFKIVDDEFSAFDKFAPADLPPGITKVQNGAQPALQGENRDEIVKLVNEKSKLPEDRELLFQREQLAGGAKDRWTTYVVMAATELTGEDVYDANVGQGSGLDNRPNISLKFTAKGGKRFADVTGANVNKRMAIVLDDVVESDPVINEKISGGSASITLGSGRSYEQVVNEATELSMILKSGAIPADITVLEERQVGASLGPELANQGVKGIMVGLIAVLFFMVIYYRKPGLIACLALILNGLFLLALMAGFGFALTLPGIAGFILTLGMAVDANVLINERIRQELKDGKNSKKAVEAGFAKVFWTIIDANVTTLIAALVLLETNSSGPIRGFALTLLLGLIVSMFTSLYVSKLFFQIALANKTSDKEVRSWLGVTGERKKYHINFMGFGKLTTTIMGVAAILVLATGLTRGMNWGVDFAGGTEVMIGFTKDVESSQIRSIGKTSGINTMTVQAIGGGKTEYLLRFEGKASTDGSDSSKEAIQTFSTFKNNITSQLASASPDFKQVSYVGPQIGQELRQQGFVSVFYAMIGVIFYIFIRFDSRFAPGALAKMFLDIFVMMGFYVFFWRSFDLTSVAAFLTVVGYSVNDTIVIYDRIRENLTAHGRRNLLDNINTSLNETLSRTINTSITTVVSLVGILAFASGQIWNFAMAMAIGVVIATISSSFVASSFILWWDGYLKKKKSGTSGRPATAKA